MSLVGFFETLKNKEIKLNLDARGNIRVIGRRDRLDPSLLAEMREKKDVIVEWLKEETIMLRPRIVAQARKTNELPVSYAQQRLWFIDQLEWWQSAVQHAWWPAPPWSLQRRHRRTCAAPHCRTARASAHRFPQRRRRATATDPRAFRFRPPALDLSGLRSEEQEQRVREAAAADAAAAFQSEPRSDAACLLSFVCRKKKECCCSTCTTSLPTAGR